MYFHPFHYRKVSHVLYKSDKIELLPYLTVKNKVIKKLRYPFLCLFCRGSVDILVIDLGSLTVNSAKNTCGERNQVIMHIRMFNFYKYM